MHVDNQHPGVLAKNPLPGKMLAVCAAAVAECEAAGPQSIGLLCCACGSGRASTSCLLPLAVVDMYDLLVIVTTAWNKYVFVPVGLLSKPSPPNEFGV